jgi:hypothetical protein
MKKLILPVIAIALLAWALLVPVAPTVSLVQGLTTLPPDGLELIMFAVTAALAWLLLKLGELVGSDLASYIQPLAVVIAPILVTIAEKYLGMIPSTYDAIVITLIHLLWLAVGSVGAYLITQRLKNKKVTTLLSPQ